jgi:hypothetical protein
MFLAWIIISMPLDSATGEMKWKTNLVRPLLHEPHWMTAASCSWETLTAVFMP